MDHMKWKFAFQLRNAQVVAISAQEVKTQVQQTYADNRISHPGRNKKEQRTLARQAHTSGSFCTGTGQTLLYHHDWEGKQRAHFALPPTEGGAGVASQATHTGSTAGSLAPDAHIQAMQLLQRAFAQHVPLQLQSWCPAGKHATPVFGPTQPTMEAILEARMENDRDCPIVVDLDIREAGKSVFVLEVYYTHETEHGSRDGIPFAEIYAGEILEKLGTPPLPGQVVQLRCQPRTDAAPTPCHCCEEELAASRALAQYTECARQCSVPRYMDDARFNKPTALQQLPDGRILVGDCNRLHIISVDLREVGTVAHVVCRSPSGFALLANGHVLVADSGNHCIRLLSDVCWYCRVGGSCGSGSGSGGCTRWLTDASDMEAVGMEVSTVAGNGAWNQHRDGAAAQARFDFPTGFALLADGRVLVADQFNHCIRLLSADLQQVRTVAGNGDWGHRDGAAAQAQFNGPTGLALLLDGRVLVADCFNHRIRVLSAESHAGGMQVSTVAGDGTLGNQDGEAAQSQFCNPRDFAVLPDGCVLVATRSGIRTLSADLQKVSTVVEKGETSQVTQLRDGRVLFCSGESICMLEAGKTRTLSASSAPKRACPDTVSLWEDRGEVQEFSCPCPWWANCRVHGCRRSHLGT